MGQEFNKDMGRYLRQRGVFRRANPLFAARKYIQILVPKKKKEELPLEYPQEQVEAIIKQAAATQRPTLKPKTAAKPVVTSIPAAQPRKVNVFMKWFGRRQEEDYETIETAQPVLDEDVKEVLKITFKWLKQMDPELIEEIKASEDFEKYKKVLDKYGLIKK